MWLVLLVAIVILIIGYALSQIEDDFGVSVIVAIIGAGITLGVVLFVLSNTIIYETEIVVAEEYQLVALENSTSAQGTFILIVGTYREKMIYKYFFEDTDGASIYQERNAINMRIYEEDRDDAVMQVIVTKTKATNYNALYQIRDTGDERTTIFRVPKGTINRSLNIDLGG